MLVAEPRFLGLLRGALDGPTADLVAGSVNHELTEAPAEEALAHVKEHLTP